MEEDRGQAGVGNERKCLQGMVTLSLGTLSPQVLDRSIQEDVAFRFALASETSGRHWAAVGLRRDKALSLGGVSHRTNGSSS